MAHVACKQDSERRNFCKDLRDGARRARVIMEDWQAEAEHLIEKIDLEESLLDDLQRQRQRTGDDAFDIDIIKQKDNIKNITRQVPIALSKARQWEAEAAMLERQLIGNDCGSFA